MRIKTFLVGALALTLAACGQPQQPQYVQAPAPVQVQQTQYQQPAAAPAAQGQSYASIAECQADPNNPNPGLCQQSFAAAQAALPHYASYNDCYALGYTCNNYGGWWGPAFAGFVLGSYLNGGYHPYPLYVGAGGYVWGNGYSLGYRPIRSYYGGVYHYGLAPHTVVIYHAPSAVYIHSVPASAYSRTTIVASAPRAVVAPTVQRGGFGQTNFGGTRPVGGAPLATAAARPTFAPAPAARPTFAPAPRPTFSSPAPAARSFGGGGFGGSRGTSFGGGGGSFRSRR